MSISFPSLFLTHKSILISLMEIKTKKERLKEGKRLGESSLIILLNYLHNGN